MQDLKQLRSLPLHNYELNYLVEDSDIQFDQKVSPLLCACYIGKIEVVMMILDNEGIDIDFESFPEEYTPLMVACFKGFYEIVRLLLQRGAKVNKPNRVGQKPILFCFSRLEEMYYKYENKKICMMLLELLLSKGADINVRIDQVQGYTVLMKLASIQITKRDKFNNTIEIIKFLIERGADPNLRSYNNKTLFDVINPTTDELLKQELINVIKTTEQTVFYPQDILLYDNDSNLKDDKSVATRIVEGDSSYNLNSSRKKLNQGGNCILDSNEMRVNCCLICK